MNGAVEGMSVEVTDRTGIFKAHLDSWFVLEYPQPRISAQRPMCSKFSWFSSVFPMKNGYKNTSDEATIASFQNLSNPLFADGCNLLYPGMWCHVLWSVFIIYSEDTGSCLPKYFRYFYQTTLHHAQEGCSLHS